MPDLIKIFTRKRPQFGKLSSSDTIELDVSLAEEHSIEAEATEEPVASGALVADHIMLLPRTLVITGVVSACTEDPLPTLSSVPRMARHVHTWGKFVDLIKSRQLFDVVTTLDVYTDMFGRRVSTSRSPEDGRSLIIRVECRKMEFGSVDIAQQVADAAFELAAAEVDLGVQGTI